MRAGVYAARVTAVTILPGKDATGAIRGTPFGVGSSWAAIPTDMSVSLLVIANALRLLKVRAWVSEQPTSE
jgi:hypothetical protein